MKSEELTGMIECLDKEGIIDTSDLMHLKYLVRPFLPNVHAGKILINLNFFDRCFSKHCQKLEGDLMCVQGDMQKVLMKILLDIENLLEK